MIKRLKRKDDDVIGPSTGVVKWVNRFFRFILYPLIRPLWFFSFVIMVVIVVVVVPSYLGVEFADIPRWYKQQIERQYTKIETKVSNEVVAPLVEKVESKVEKVSSKKVNVKAMSKEPGKRDLVAYESPQVINRRAFQKAQEVPVDVKATLQKAMKETVEFKRNDKLELVYLEIPKRINGRVEVVNANELRIGDDVFFLYGIYVNPTSDKGKEAERYLLKTIAGKYADCYVGAYSKDGTGTVICIYDGVNINQRLVDLKYSKDVSLN